MPRRLTMRLGIQGVLCLHVWYRLPYLRRDDEGNINQWLYGSVKLKGDGKCLSLHWTIPAPNGPPKFLGTPFCPRCRWQKFSDDCSFDVCSGLRSRRRAWSRSEKPNFDFSLQPNIGGWSQIFDNRSNTWLFQWCRWLECPKSQILEPNQRTCSRSPCSGSGSSVMISKQKDIADRMLPLRK